MPGFRCSRNTVTLTEAAVFSKIYYHTQCQNSMVSGTSGTSNFINSCVCPVIVITDCKKLNSIKFCGLQGHNSYQIGEYLSAGSKGELEGTHGWHGFHKPSLFFVEET